MGSLVAELAEKLSSATNNFDIDEGTIYVNTSADTVGIGTTTPGSKLDVQGTMQVGVNDTGHDVKFFGATAGAYLEWDESADELELRGGAATPGKLLLSTAETTVVDGNKLGQIDFQAPLDSAGTDAILVGASIYAEADATFSSSVNATELVFATGASEAAAEKMRIASDGKVGIGNATPATVLDVADDQANGSGKTEVMRLYSGADITDDGPYLVLSTGMGDCRVGSYRQAFGGTEAGSSFYVSTAYNDGTGGSTSVLERFRVQANGNVGIGTTAPNEKLDVAGAIMATGALGSHQTSAFVMHQVDSATSEIRAYGADASTAGVLRLRGYANDGSPFNSGITLAADGNIGVGTTAPDQLLVSAGTGNVINKIEAYTTTAAQGPALILARSNNGTLGTQTAVDSGDMLGAIYFQGSSGTAFATGPNIQSFATETFSGTATGGDLRFYTTDNTTTTSDMRMVINHNGDIGIGVSTPSVRLDVFSTDEVAACFSRGADTDTYVTIRTAETQNRQAGRYHIVGSSASSTVGSSNSVTGTISKVENSGGTLKGSYAIHTNRGDSLTEGFKVDEDGYHFFNAYATGKGHIAYWNHHATYTGVTTATYTFAPSNEGWWFSFGTTNFYADVFVYGGKLTGGAWKFAAVRVDDGGYKIGSGTGTTALYNGSSLFSVEDPSNSYTFSNNGGINQMSFQRTSGTTAYDVIVRTYGQYVG